MASCSSLSDGLTHKLYIKPGCPWCSQVTLWLDEQGYRYKTVDVIADDNAFDEMKEISGQSLAPTLLVEGEVSDAPAEAAHDADAPARRLVLPDFGVEELRDFLKEHGIGPGRR